jgi:fumarylacetoacetase
MNLYWSMAQQLAHATANGANVRPGDLFASGTVSGPTRDEFGSLLEITWNGTELLDLGNGESRTFLEDGDKVTMRGRCSAEGAVSIGFGECTGTVVS